MSSKLYKELEGKYSNLKSDYDELSSSNDQEILQKKELEQQLSMLQASFEDVQSCLTIMVVIIEIQSFNLKFLDYCFAQQQVVYV